MIVAVAFLKNEKKETFLWLIRTLLKFNANKNFYVILTDYDKAIDVALDEIKENTMPIMTHLLCHRHLNNNLIKQNVSWLNNLKGDKNYL